MRKLQREGRGAFPISADRATTITAKVSAWIGTFLVCGVGLAALFLDPPRVDASSRAVCRDAADCNVAGTRELNAGRMAAAQAAFETEVCFAWREDEMASSVRAHNNLALLALRRGEPLQARFWAAVALKLDPASRAARHNARLADEAVARLPPGQGLTGTYEHRWGASVGDQVWIQELPGKRIRFELWAVRIQGGLQEDPCPFLSHTLGGASGDAALTGRAAVWEMKEWKEEGQGTCRLRFSFGPDQVTVEQDGDYVDCGFGHGVYADGVYLRTSRQPPRFTVPSPAEGDKVGIDLP